MTRVLISVIARNSHQNRHRLRRSMSGTPRRHQREKNSELTAYMAVNIYIRQVAFCYGSVRPSVYTHAPLLKVVRVKFSLR